MRISDLELFLIQTPGPEGERRSLVVRIVCDSGWEGWGEVPSSLRSEELAGARQLLTSALAERHVADIEEIIGLEILARLHAVSAVEMACWDALARAAKLPLCRLWGGCFRARVPICRNLSCDGDGSAAALVQGAREWAEQGYRALQVTCVGTDPKFNLRRLNALRTILTEGVELRFDGREQFSPTAAVDFVTGLPRDGFRFLLDLTDSSEPADQQRLHAVARSPLALGRSIQQPADVVRALDTCEHFVLSPERHLEGWQGLRRSAAVADAAGCTASLSVPYSTGLAAAMLLHVVAATPSLAAAHDLGDLTADSQILEEPLKPQDGMLAVPLGMGLGVEVSRARLEACQVG